MAANQQNIQALVGLQEKFADVRDEIKAILDTRGTGMSYQFKETLSLATKINTELRETLVLEEKLGSEYISRSNIQAKIKLNQGQIAELVAKLKTRNTAISAQIQRDYDNYVRQRKIVDDINSSANDRQQAEAEIARQLQNLEATARGVLNRYNQTGTAIDGQNASLHQSLVMAIRLGQEQSRMNSELDKSNDKYTKQLLRLGMINKLIRGISKIPIAGDLVNTAAIKDAMERGYGDDDDDDLLGALREGAKVAKTELSGALNSVVFKASLLGAGIKFAVDAMLRLNSLSVDMQNTMGISGRFTTEILNDWENFQYATGDSLVNLTNMSKSLSDLQNLLQTNALFSNQQLKDQIDMTEKMGLQAEEAAQIQKFALINGRSASQVLSVALKTNTTSVSYKKIMKDISNISAETYTRYQGNLEQIAKSVVLANKLGFNMDQASKASEALLDFQSSISNELEAELLNGKQLNLERARSFALDGKDAEAVAEITRQFGGMDRLMKLNVIQRKSLASLLGMSSDEMMEMFRTQKLYNELGVQDNFQLREKYANMAEGEEKRRFEQEILKKQNGEILLQDLQQVSTQKTLQQTLTKISDLLQQIAQGPLMRFAEGISKILSDAVLLKATLYGLIGGTAGLLVGGVPGALIGATIGAGVGSFTAGHSNFVPPNNRHADGGIITRPHVGMVGEAGPEAVIPLNKQNMLTIKGVDQLVEQNKQLLEQNRKMLEVISKGGNVYLDSTKVGYAQGMAYSSFG